MSSATVGGAVHVATGVQHLAALQVGTQRLGDAHRPVRLLVGLEDRHDRAGHRAQRAVERGHVRGAAGRALVAHPDVEPAGLEVGAVRRRGELAVLALGGDPRLAVELPLGREAEVAGRDVDDAEGQLELGEELLLPREQALVLGVGLLDGV